MSLRHSSSENRSARWIVSTTPALATTASHPRAPRSRRPTPARTAPGRGRRSSRWRPRRARCVDGCARSVAGRDRAAGVRERLDDRAADAACRARHDHAPAARHRANRHPRPVRATSPCRSQWRRGMSAGSLYQYQVHGSVAKSSGGSLGYSGYADPADRQRLVHERAVRAVQREPLAPVAPVVCARGSRRGRSAPRSAPSARAAGRSRTGSSRT